MEETTPTEAQKVEQPKTLHKLAVRTTIGLFVVAGLLGVYTYLRGMGQDIDLPADVNTAGTVAAIQYHESGSQAVLIRPDGTIHPSPGYRPGAQDRDIVWRPDGNRVFFASDRDEGVFHMFRWNPGSDKVERRSFGARTHQFPSFAYINDAAEARKVLVAAGGKLLDLDPKDGSATQVLPPVVEREQTQGNVGEGEGSTSDFEALYKNLGHSFKKARYALGKTWIVAVMQRDDGQLLIAQRLQKPGEKPSRPVPLAAGDQVDFDVSPLSGILVFVTIGFEFPEEVPPEFIKDGRVVKPFQNTVGFINLEDMSQAAIVVASNRVTDAFAYPGISPDGQFVLITACRNESGALTPLQLVRVPVKPNGGSEAAVVRPGPAADASWTPDGRAVLFVVTNPRGEKEIRVIGVDGEGERTLTAGKGSFGQPSASPQIG